MNVLVLWCKLNKSDGFNNRKCGWMDLIMDFHSRKLQITIVNGKKKSLDFMLYFNEKNHIFWTLTVEMRINNVYDLKWRNNFDFLTFSFFISTILQPSYEAINNGKTIDWRSSTNFPICFILFRFHYSAIFKSSIQTIASHRWEKLCMQFTFSYTKIQQFQ